MTDLRSALATHMAYSLGKDPAHASLYDWRVALSLAVRDQIVDPWFQSTRQTYREQGKRVYYLSMEFLIGRLLGDAILNLDLEGQARAALAEHGVDYGAAILDEPDAALGNGGLGRLAACFLDSLSTLGVPAYGYGIRYEHGLFRQSFDNGEQREQAEDWLQQRHVWEFERPEAAWRIGFGGHVEYDGDKGRWRPEEEVVAAAYDTPVIGWRGRWANTLRLWSAKPTRIFDLARFNRGEYAAAAEPEALARTISRVLYPDDTTEAGKELRLKQEYFFAAASIRDLLRRFSAEYPNLRALPEKVAIQLNDTHPAIAAPEMIRLLVDERGMDLQSAIAIACGCLNYTNHTLLPEALERWSTDMMWRVLPRHMRIIEQVNDWHAKQRPTRSNAASAIEHGAVKMGELAFICANRVNGVSALHTDLMKKTVFHDLNALHPERIVNQTNGVTPRRWLAGCNPGLSALITSGVGEGWQADLEQLEGLAPLADDAGFRESFHAAKRANKLRLAQWLAEAHGVAVDPDALFDIQIKRIHEYKRQHLNLLETIALWQEMRDDPTAGWTPRVKIFGGKAAPGYWAAKEIIHLINDAAQTINNDPVTRGLLTIAYPPNYNVSMAELLIPAADLSEQISTAGKEASGTGNMKLSLNGALTIGTLDGANVEIREQVGAENFFLFGLTADEVVARRSQPDYSRAAIEASPRLKRALHAIASGDLSGGDGDRHRALVSRMYESDYFLATVDFDDYWRIQRTVDAAYQNNEHWTRMAALNVAKMGWFSSDRTIRGYARDIWGVTPKW